MAKAKESLETKMKLLEEITKKMEEGNIPLEESLDLYVKGVKLVAECKTTLENAKLQIINETKQQS